VFWPHDHSEKSILGIKKSNAKELNPILKCVDIEIKKGSLVCIIGEVGSGKTAFFDLILNE